MKIVFLDIEGVLSVYGMMDSNCCLRLKHILDTTGAKIVLSSSWRLYDDNLDYVVKRLSPYGIGREYFVGKTPIFGAKNRGYEILQWLNVNLYVSEYVVLDDNYISSRYVPDECFVQTDPSIGLSQEKMQTCIDKLR
ncbi:MAG: hypothetical protein LBK70_01330 [Clostridiales bacterium]|nr:hypothetical protein [Clostridiales bacterium]